MQQQTRCVFYEISISYNVQKNLWNIRQTTHSHTLICWSLTGCLLLPDERSQGPRDQSQTRASELRSYVHTASIPKHALRWASRVSLNDKVLFPREVTTFLLGVCMCSWVPSGCPPPPSPKTNWWLWIPPLQYVWAASVHACLPPHVKLVMRRWRVRQLVLLTLQCQQE